jgi:hypothetical protein
MLGLNAEYQSLRIKVIKMKRFLRGLLVYAVCLAGFWAPICRAELKPDELFTMMRDSRSRYVSIEAQMDVKGFYPNEEKQEKPVLMYSQHMVYRRIENRMYAECITQTFSEAGQPSRHLKEIAVITPDGKMYYREEPLGSKKRHGQIQKDEDLSGWMSLTPDIVFWQDLAMPGIERKRLNYLRHNADKASLSYEQAAQVYILETPAGDDQNAPWFRYTVDASKGYMPTVQEWFDGNKTLLQKSVCGGYRQVNGLWAPFRYSIYLPNGNLVTDVTIRVLSINQPIPAKKFTLEFPLGTRVTDRIGNTEYTVGIWRTLVGFFQGNTVSSSRSFSDGVHEP